MVNLLSFLRQRYHKTNLEQVVDQVVGMIFRVTPSEQIELLFLQRAYSVHDYYSGDICFPGGYREKGEKCLDTAIRQTEEEIGLIIKPEHYLGALQFSFTTKYGKSRVRENSNNNTMLRMGILMFHIDYTMSLQIKLTEKQIRAYKWISLRYFTEGDINNFAFHNVVHKEAKVMFPAFIIGMERRLFGLTFYSLILFLVSVRELAEKNPNLKVKYDQKFYQALQYHCTNIHVEGTEEDYKLAKVIYLDKRVGFLKPKL